MNSQSPLTATSSNAPSLPTPVVIIAEFFLAYVYSNTDIIQANPHYLDYSSHKRANEKPTPAE